MRSFRSLLAVLTAGLLAICLTAPGCGGDSGGGPRPHGGGSGGAAADSGVGGLGNTGAGVCLLNNCSTDAECEGCTFGRDKCKVDETRCVACFEQKDCKTGEICTSFGTCAPKDLQCPTDGAGAPTISCSQDSDCLACDPLHQVCDVTQSKCVACMIGSTQSCTGNQTCGATGKCEDKCPASCTADTECANCSNGGGGGKARENHVFAGGWPTMPCPRRGVHRTKGR